MKEHSRNGGVAPHILNLRTECGDWLDLWPQHLYPARKNIRQLITQEAVRFSDPVWVIWRRGNIVLLLLEFKCWTNIITIPTVLYLLRCNNNNNNNNDNNNNLYRLGQALRVPEG